MSEPASIKPRTWRPIALWSAAILLALGLAWFVGAVAVPVWQTRAAVKKHAINSDFIGAVRSLGGPEQAASKLRFYFLLPERWTESRWFAARLLGHCGPSAAPSLRRLLRAPESESTDVRIQALDSLNDLAPSSAVPELIAALEDKDPTVRSMSAKVLGRIGPQAQEAVPALTRILTDIYSNTRCSAARALGEIGPGASEAIGPLTKAGVDPEGEVRAAAAEALKKIRGEEPKP